ncbi:MAG: DUF2141 domain-containing protein [Bacteroidota bacterium]
MIVKMFLIHLLFAMQLPAEAIKTGTIFIDFSGIEKREGYIQINIFNNAKGFPNAEQSMVKTLQIKVEKENNTVQIPDFPFGEYAISCYHDANGNKKLDTNFFGIPKEKVGASNNPPSGSIPSYIDAKFVLNSDRLTLSIQLN